MWHASLLSRPARVWRSPQLDVALHEPDDDLPDSEGATDKVVVRALTERKRRGKKKKDDDDDDDGEETASQPPVRLRNRGRHIIMFE